MRQLLTSKGADEPNTVHTTRPADLNPPASSEVVETPTIVSVTAPSEAVELASPSVAENSSASTPCQENSEEFSPSPESSTESLPCMFEVRRFKSEESATAEESQQTEG